MEMWKLRLGAGILVGCVAFAAACGSSDSGSSPKSDGGSGAAGASGSGGSSGASGSGGASGSAGASGSGGASGSAGGGAGGVAGSDGGDSSVYQDPRCIDLCTAMEAANCPNTSTMAECVLGCTQAATNPTCGSLFGTFLDCLGSNPAVACNSSGEARPTICTNEATAAFGCVASDAGTD